MSRRRSSWWSHQGKPPLFVARGRDPYFAPWADTAQIDHFSPGARAAMVAELVQIGRHCDGLRCDMAMLVLNDVFARTWAHLLQDRPAPDSEFWTDAIAALPAGFIWIAEAYWDMEPRLQALGFNYTYDKRLYDRLIAADAGQIRAHLGADVGEQTRMARFVENHDEPRAMATFGRQRLPGLTALIATLPGLRFFHEGQFEGRTIHLPMPLDRAAAEPEDAELLAVCRRILRIADDPVFHDGAWALVPVAGDQADALIAYEWRLGTARRLVVLNIGAHLAQGWVRIAEAPDAAPTTIFRDLLDDQSYVRDHHGLVERGLYVRLEAHQAHVFAV